MVYPEGIVIQLFLNKKAHVFAAKWPPEKQVEIAPAKDVAQDVLRVIAEIGGFIAKGILEGFPEPEAIVAPDGGRPALKIVGPDGKEVKTKGDADEKVQETEQ
jgi:hypothetical protein